MHPLKIPLSKKDLAPEIQTCEADLAKVVAWGDCGVGHVMYNANKANKFPKTGSFRDESELGICCNDIVGLVADEVGIRSQETESGSFNLFSFGATKWRVISEVKLPKGA